MDVDDVLRTPGALDGPDVRYAVFGGLAMAGHGFDGAARDLERFVTPDEANIERLGSALSSVSHDPDIGAITAEDPGA